MNLVWVEQNELGWAVRIFKNRKAAYETIDSPKLISKALAVSQVRRQVLARQEGICINCPEILTLASMHLHERLHRGQFDSDGRSGEISLENSEGLCAACHVLGPRSAHGKERSPQFTKRTTEEWEPRTR